MGGVTTRNMQSSLQKYSKLYIVASCWTIIDIDIWVYLDLSRKSNFHYNLAKNYGYFTWRPIYNYDKSLKYS